MNNYFQLVSDELLIKLAQTKQFIKKHNPTIGILTEEILRTFLKNYLSKSVSVEQGFILSKNGEMSKQCDILIYDSNNYAPFYRINDIVIVPDDSVIAIIEVKTTITKQIFHQVIDYFENICSITNAKKYLFIYNACKIEKLSDYFHSYNHKSEYQQFDHDTFQSLPDEITGLNNSFHLKKDHVVNDRDTMGYSSYFYDNVEGTEINALQNFYLSLYKLVENYHGNIIKTDRSTYYGQCNFKSYFAIELFDM